MMRFFCIIIITCGISACSQGKKDGDAAPKNLVPQDKMKLVLFDVMRAQEYATLKYGKDTAAVNNGTQVLMQLVFTIHKITKDDFFTSFRYYEAHPDQNQALFDSVASYTNQKRQDLYKFAR